MTAYTSIKLPKVLAKQIGDLAESNGYRSVSDFVLDAARTRVRECING